MGGHGGLNILPQKRWNVYRFDNMEKVRLDEKAAAKEEQLKREQSRKRDSEYRLEQLRTARGLAPVSQGEKPAEMDSKPGHINLFEGIKIFDPIKKVLEIEGGDGKDGFKKNKKVKREKVEFKAVTAEDEKYRMGYGVAGKGVKLPWYLERPSTDANDECGKDDESSRGLKKSKSGKQTLEELREERLRREKLEKERECNLIRSKRRSYGAAVKVRKISGRYERPM